MPTVNLTTSSGSAGGTVTSVSVASANGFAGTVANATTTPAITLSTSVTGVLKGNGTAISEALADTDYQAPITLTTTGTKARGNIFKRYVKHTLNILELYPMVIQAAICLPARHSQASTVSSMIITAGQATDSTNIRPLTGGSFNWNITNGNAANGYQGGTTLPNSTTVSFLCNRKIRRYRIGVICQHIAYPTLPTGYSSGFYRRIFSLNTSASGVLQAGTAIEVAGGAMQYYLATQIQDINVSNLTTARSLYTLSVPTGIKVQPTIRASNGSSNYILVQSPDETDVASTAWNGTPGHDTFSPSTGQCFLVYATTNTSGQIAARANAASTMPARSTPVAGLTSGGQ